MVAQQIIIKIGMALSIAVVVILVARKFQIGSLFGTAISDTQKFFDDSFGGLGDSISGISSFLGFGESDNSSSIAGQTVTLDDGTEITIPEDTVVNDDGTVSSSTSPTFQLPPDEEARVIQTIRDSKSANKQLAELRDNKLNQEQILAISETLNLLANSSDPSSDTPFTQDGFIVRGFTSGETALRIANTTIATDEGRFKSIESGEEIAFGGFGTALNQEIQLREAIRQSKEENPEFFV